MSLSYLAIGTDMSGMRRRPSTQLFLFLTLALAAGCLPAFAQPETCPENYAQLESYFRSRPVDPVSDRTNEQLLVAEELGEIPKIDLKALGYSTSDFTIKHGQLDLSGQLIEGSSDLKLDRMLRNLQSKGIKVVYDRQYLKLMGGGYVPSEKILLIDRETLEARRPSVAFLHEARHIGLNRKNGFKISPSSMLLRLRKESSRIAPNVGYLDSMSFEELSTHLQDFRWLASNALASDPASPKRANYLRELKHSLEIVEAGLIRYSEYFEHIGALDKPGENFAFTTVEKAHELKNDIFEIQFADFGWADGYSVGHRDGENGTVQFYLDPRPGTPEEKLRALNSRIVQIRNFSLPVLTDEIPKISAVRARLESIKPENLNKHEVESLIHDLAPTRRAVNKILHFSPADI
ncbi:MAG: hypothetical protein ACXWQO_01730 [Bdellovibrionota bacterium]